MAADTVWPERRPGPSPGAAAGPRSSSCPTTPGLSARWHVHDYPGTYCRWHYHPEHEIHLIQRSTGTAIVGDHVGRFAPGHLVLVGSNLPHHWISDTEDGERVVERDVVLQLHPDWFDACQRLLPELGAVRGVFERAARGLEFTGETAERAAVELVAVGHTTGTRRIGHLLELLRLLEEAGPDEAHPLASPWTPALDGAAGLRPRRPHPHLPLQPRRRRRPARRGGRPGRAVRVGLLPVLPARERPDLHRDRPQAPPHPCVPPARADRPAGRHRLPARRLPEPVELQPPVPRRARPDPAGVPPQPADHRPAERRLYARRRMRRRTGCPISSATSTAAAIASPRAPAETRLTSPSVVWPVLSSSRPV